ncbi:MAG: GNAT family N-acetyltransferase [Bryobacteraceae bacterium]
MLSITHHLARRLELAEAEDGSACAQADQLLNPGSDAISEPFLGGYLVYAGAGSPFTHALGLGLSGSVTEADIEHMETFYRSRGAGITVDLSPYADPTLLENLAKRNYKATDFVTVLARQLSAGDMAAGEPTVRPAEASEASRYAETVVRGFFGRDEVSPEEQHLGRILAALPSASAYFAMVDGVPAGCGQLAFHGGTATCFGDSTLTGYRRRGAHSALIRARIAAAARGGCDVITAGTQPGSISQRDYERQGFQVAYTKVTMVLD